jgi:hypothetical protein
MEEDFEGKEVEEFEEDWEEEGWEEEFEKEWEEEELEDEF